MLKTIYHGSKDIIKTPLFNKGKYNNDYGKGFYCTENIELAKEWAVGYKADGYANIYTIDTNGLSILDLDEYSSLTWLAILLENRRVTVTGEIAKHAIKYLKNNFSIDYRKYDIIYGYRADDSYFDFARNFLNNTITLETLQNALKLGNLGKQFVLISKDAFSRIHYVGNEIAKYDNYYLQKIIRDEVARDLYYKNKYSAGIKGLYISDILEEGLTKNDI